MTEETQRGGEGRKKRKKERESERARLNMTGREKRERGRGRERKVREMSKHAVCRGMSETIPLPPPFSIV